MNQSASGRLQWRLVEPFGVEVAANLSEPLNADEARLFRNLFYQNSLLIAKGQKLSMEEQIRVMEYIEPVLRSPETVGHISSLSDKGALGTQELLFHSDIAWTTHPRRAGSLHPLVVTDGASYTAFANGIRAYAKLPAALKNEIKDLVSLQMLSHSLEQGVKPLGAKIDMNMPHARHPLVKPHPVTGQPIIYLNQLDSVRIEGVDATRMLTLGAELFEYLYDKTNIHTHWWHMGDLVIWDNLALQHARGNCENVGERTLQRVAIGDKTMAELDSRLDVNKNPKVRDFLSNSYGKNADAVKINELAS